MVEFYTWSAEARLFITVFFALCALAQATTLVLSGQRYPKNRERRLESLLELALLLLILCLSLLHGQIHLNIDDGYMAPMAYGNLRLAAFAVVALTAGLVAIRGHRLLPLFALLPALVVLPVFESIVGVAYPWLYLCSLLFLLARSVILSRKHYLKISSGLSALSIKEAIDNLHTGVMFCRPDGRILLISRQMQRLITEISGKACRNGRLFYEQLIGNQFVTVVSHTEMEGQRVCLLGGGTAWMFTKAEIKSGGKTYIQLTATDVSERYRLTQALREQDATLRQKSAELKNAIAGLQQLSQDRETAKAKARAHDVLGQRLTMLLRMVRGDQPMDMEQLASLGAGLLEEIRTEARLPDPYEALAELKQIIGAIGVNVDFAGGFPKDEKLTLLFIDIIREAITNAVRHGFATEIVIRSCLSDGVWNLHISDNGHGNNAPIAEGGGITGMRSKLAEKGGTLTLAQTPSFMLSVVLPGGEI